MGLLGGRRVRERDQVVDPMCGRWKLDHALTNGQDAYLAALDVPEATREGFRDYMAGMTSSKITRDGDGVSFSAEFANGRWTHATYHLGRATQSSRLSFPSECLVAVEDGRLVAQMAFRGQEVVCTRFLDNGKLVLEHETKGKTATYQFNRISDAEASTLS